MICKLDELTHGKPRLVHVDGEDIVLVRQDDEVFALSDVCSHAEVSLSTGDVSDGAIECWLHGSRFDLRTGEPSGPPAWRPVQTYPTAIHPDGTVAVTVPSAVPRAVTVSTAVPRAVTVSTGVVKKEQDVRP